MSENAEENAENTLETYVNYLKTYYSAAMDEITALKAPTKCSSININFLELFDNAPTLAHHLLESPAPELNNWSEAASSLLSDSKRATCRFFDLPTIPELHRTAFPRNNEADKLLQLVGVVTRTGAVRLVENKRRYDCLKCKTATLVRAEFDLKYRIEAPKLCPCCHSPKMRAVEPEKAQNWGDYQEIKLQESVNHSCIPKSLLVVLEDDLVDSCQPGDNLTLVGVLRRRWGPLVVGRKIDIELVFHTNHLRVNNPHQFLKLGPEIGEFFSKFWLERRGGALGARNSILGSFCPKLFGMYWVKLALAVVLAGGGASHVRAECHLLLVGDPGTGKSELLRFASKVIPRSVVTTGAGSSAAGLTCTAVKEDGEWQLQAGALVLSNGGVCCIDEFNSMKEHDRNSIHEAMEQQRISVAKAGIVCKLKTKCTILAAANPKGRLDPQRPLHMNIAIPSPLLSRFDLVLPLRDHINETWDRRVADYVFDTNKAEPACEWGIDTLQAYYATIKRLHPELSDAAHRVLDGYYKGQRRRAGRNAARTTTRMLDSLIRLGQAHARLMFRSRVKVMDAIFAVGLVEVGMERGDCLFGFGFDLQGAFPDDPEQDYEQLKRIVLEKLNLAELLDDEDDSKVEKMEVDETNTRFDTTTASTTSQQEHLTPKLEETSLVEEETINLVNDSIVLNQIPSINDSFRLTDFDTTIAGTSGQQAHLTSKTKATSLVENEAVNLVDDLRMLNQIPSINDSFKLADFGTSIGATLAGPSTSTQVHLTPKTKATSLEEDETVNLVNDLKVLNKMRSVRDSFNLSDFVDFGDEEDAPMEQPKSPPKSSKRAKFMERFKFKPVINPESAPTVQQQPPINNPASSQTIFETQEDFDSIDLSL